MPSIWNRLFGGECQHIDTLVVTCVGVTRAVCEQCGHISFEMNPTSAFEWTPDVSEPDQQLPKVSGL